MQLKLGEHWGPTLGLGSWRAGCQGDKAGQQGPSGYSQPVFSWLPPSPAGNGTGADAPKPGAVPSGIWARFASWKLADLSGSCAQQVGMSVLRADKKVFRCHKSIHDTVRDPQHP